MELQGTIERIEDEKQITDKFKKREFVIITEKDTDYPQFISLECTQDKCSLLDSFTVGSEVKVSINVRGRNWTNPEGIVKTFNTLQAWRIELEGEDVRGADDVKETMKPESTKVEDTEPDDLPF